MSYFIIYIPFHKNRISCLIEFPMWHIECAIPIKGILKTLFSERTKLTSIGHTISDFVVCVFFCLFYLFLKFN